jgi:hypothetical protein
MSKQRARRRGIDDEALQKLGIRRVDKPSDFKGVGIVADPRKLMSQGLSDVSRGDVVGIRCQDAGCFRIQLEVYRTGHTQSIRLRSGMSHGTLQDIGIEKAEKPSDFEGVGIVADPRKLTSQGLSDVSAGDVVGIRCQDAGCFRIQLEIHRTSQLLEFDFRTER